jgi:putative alpha-1,2-mannosidase
MIQPSPDTRIDGWDACSGYYYADSTINGFSHTHVSGTGLLFLRSTLGFAGFGELTVEGGWIGWRQAPGAAGLVILTGSSLD